MSSLFRSERRRPVLQEALGNSKKGEGDAESMGSEIEGKFEDEVDALFKLPLPEFTGARNDLAARLKRGGRSDDANVVKALAKPSVSAWAVNQLYWNHREAFDRLLTAGQRFCQSQASSAVEKPAGMRESLESRREAVSHLSELAASLLRDAGHSPTPDTIHRVITTLEAVSAYASLSDGPTPGRLTRDVDPPGFESLASLMAGAGTTKANQEPTPLTPSQANQEPTSVTPSQESGSVATRTRQEAPPSGDVQKARELEETRRAKIADARASLEDAKRSLAEASARAERLEAAQEKADAEANQAEKELLELEARLKQASAASRDAAARLQSMAAEAKRATRAVEDAERNVENASKELESILQESGDSY